MNKDFYIYINTCKNIVMHKCIIIVNLISIVEISIFWLKFNIFLKEFEYKIVYPAQASQIIHKKYSAFIMCIAVISSIKSNNMCV